MGKAQGNLVLWSGRVVTSYGDLRTPAITPDFCLLYYFRSRPYLTLPRPSLRNVAQTSIAYNLHDRGEVTIMDFNLDGFFSVENIISAIFNGVPLFPDPQGTQMLPPTQSSQGSQDVLVTLPPTPIPTSTSTLNYTSIYYPAKIDRSESSPSLSTQSGDDAHNQARPEDTAPPPKLDKTSSVYTDNSSLLLLAPGKLHTSSYDL
jgi:hypothetical protein